MQKAELRKLRALNVTPTMMKKGKLTEERKVWYSSGKMIVPVHDSLLRIQNLNGYIKIAVFLPKDIQKDITTPRYEIFLNVPGGEYITRELDKNGQEVKWLTAMVWNLPELDDNWHYGYNRKDYINADGMQTLNRLQLKNDKGKRGLRRLVAWQQEQKDAQRKLQEQRQQAPWDADMKLVPEIMPGFTEWMRKEAASEYYMIYEYDPKGQKTGYCSRCKKMVPIKKPKHGKETTCPSCKTKSTFKAHTRLQTLATPTYDAQIVQKISGGIVIRRFWQRQYYRDKPYTEPKIITGENERVLILEDGTRRRYKWDLYKNKYMRWIREDSASYCADSSVKLYKRNLAQMKKHSLLKQSAYDLWPKLPMPIERYLQIEKGNPAVEMLARIGMFRLAKGLIQERYDKTLLDESATEIAKMLKIDKSRLKRLKEMDGNVYSLRWLQYEKQANTIWPDEMIKDFSAAGFDCSVFNFLPHPIPSFVKCHNYLKKQMALIGENMKQTLITWRDYINMAEQLKMNTRLDQISRPKDVKIAHDECVLLKQQKGLEKQAKEIEKKWPKVNKQLSKLQKFEFTSDEYAIVAPKRVFDIVMEGTILKHCVHTCDYYFSRIQTDESYLFFLRKSKHPDMPWYTLEVEPSGNIRQKRTTGDNQNPDFQKAVPFLKKWQKFFREQLTEEEEKLGKKADELREENYKNLRKNGNRVWHGKLAGQLLADVLEADFMAAV